MTSDRLFVYGTLMRGFDHPMARLLSANADFLGEATCRGRLYLVRHYPGLVLSDDSADVVHGELFRLRARDELLREFDDHIPPQKAAQRKEWVALATEVQYTAWDLAEQARAGNGDMSHKSIVRINQACQTCHAKFRD